MFDSTRNFLKTREMKVKKNVDTKASKGRKLRFDVMEKLIGFVAPSDMAELPARNDIVNNLFGGLLLKKRSTPGYDLEDNGVVKKLNSDEILQEHDVELF